MFQIHLLGSLRLAYKGQPLKFAALPKTLPLFAYLLLHRAQPLARMTVAFTLWPDVGEVEARSNLRRHLYELRRVLPPAPDDQPWLLTETATLQWNPHAPTWLDVEHFAQASADPQRLAEAAALYQGDLLPECDEEWIFFARERLRNLFMDDLAKLITQHRARQEYPQAIGYAQQLLRHDPLREDATRELMTLRHAGGDRTGALEEYRRFEQRVRSELGVEPMLETKALYDAIAQDLFRTALPPAQPTTLIISAPTPTITAPAVASTVATPPIPSEPPHNLPAQLTSFIGREGELAFLREWLLSSQMHQRLLTLTGPGGSGKSRLASEGLLRLRIDHPERFPHGIFAVWLSTLQQPEQVLPAIANVFNLSETPGRPLLESLQDYLRHKTLCLLLDNFEHLLAAVPDIHRLLSAAERVVLVITSRASLQIYGEQEFPVAPLTLPAHNENQPVELVNCSAVALFVARSRAVNHTFTLTAKNSAAVVEICQRLDGLPLALELAAARSKLFTPQAILARLVAAPSAELTFLADRTRTQSERHQTLQATIAWSYNLLTPAEQQRFVALAIFPGSFTLEQAEAICDLEARGDCFAQIEALVNSSLLRQTEEGDEIHFRYLWTIRDFARSLLAQQPTLAAHLGERHARHFLGMATAETSHLSGFQQQDAYTKLQAAHANLQAAMTWALQAQQTTIAFGFAAALTNYWLHNSHLLNEGRSYLTKVLALPGAHLPTAERAIALVGAATLEMRYAHQTHPRQITLCEEALQIAAQLQNAELMNSARIRLIRPLLYAGALEKAVRLVEESLAYARPQRHQPWTLAQALHSAALTARFANDLPRTQALTEEALALFQSVGDQWAANFLLVDLALAHHQRGDFALARTLFERCLPLARASGDRMAIASVLVNLADLALLGEAYELVEDYAQTALTMFLDLGEQWQPPRLLRRLALIALQRGEREKAVALCHEALARCRTINSLHGQSACFVTFAAIHAHGKEYPQSITLLAFAHALLKATTVPLLPVDATIYAQTLSTARPTLTEEAFTAAWAMGESLTIEQAVLHIPQN